MILLERQVLGYQRFILLLSDLLADCGIDYDPGPVCLTDPEVPDLRTPEWVVGTIKTIIDERPGEAHSLDRLSEEVHLSKYHLARLFRDIEGMPPWRYVQQARIKKASELLLDEDLSLAEVAFAAGFYDQSHLTNAFKRATGQTPGAFREERKILQEPDASEA